MQSFSDILGQVFRAIAANKLRTFLTMFGIAWGVGSLLVLVGLGEGFRSGQHRQMSTLGNDIWAKASDPGSTARCRRWATTSS